MTAWLASSKQSARRIKQDVVALWIAARDPRTPLAAKILAGAVAAYALNPLDLIPDFIPVLGYLDDISLCRLAVLAGFLDPASPVLPLGKMTSSSNNELTRGLLLSVSLARGYHWNALPGTNPGSLGPTR